MFTGEIVIETVERVKIDVKTTHGTNLQNELTAICLKLATAEETNALLKWCGEKIQQCLDLSYSKNEIDANITSSYFPGNISANKHTEARTDLIATVSHQYGHEKTSISLSPKKGFNESKKRNELIKEYFDIVNKIIKDEELGKNNSEHSLRRRTELLENSKK